MPYLSFLPDGPYLRLLYRLRMGSWPHLRKPRTFNEKIQWLKMHHQDPAQTALVDKLTVKDHVARLCGPQYVIPTLGVWERAQDIDFDALPPRFVLKCTHDSGSLVLCTNKAELNQAAARARLAKALKRNFWRLGREHCYKDVPRRILAEPYLEPAPGEELIDYKFFCFHGKVDTIATCSERRSPGGLKVTFFSPRWERLPYIRHYPASEVEIPRPASLEEMLRLAERLAAGHLFVRVDFYEVQGRPLFGELTFFPGCGMEEFDPPGVDLEWGERLHIDI